MSTVKFTSLMLGAIGFVLAGFLTPPVRLFSESTIIVLIVNLALILAIRQISKWEDISSQLSVWMIIASVALLAIVIEATLVRLIVGVAYVGVLGFMRHVAKHEAFEETRLVTKVQPRR